jgi:hypothetical protein
VLPSHSLAGSSFGFGVSSTPFLCQLGPPPSGHPFCTGNRVTGFGFAAFSSWPSLAYPSAEAYAEYPFDPDGITGELRLRVEPKEAQVFVDGYYAGLVNEFNGHFHHLKLIPGPHHIDVRAAGYETLDFDINIEAFQTTEYRETLKRSPR